MDSTVSVSKGVFLFPNGYKKSKNIKKKQKVLFKTLNSPWYKSFKNNWTYIEDSVKDLHLKTYNTLLCDIVDHIKSFQCNELNLLDGIIPSATLLTGVNQPDHVSQFIALSERIKDEITPHVALISSQDSSTVKHIVENTVWQFCNEDSMDKSYQDEESINQSPLKLKKNQCTMKTLQNWYHDMYTKISPKKNKAMKAQKKSLVVIIPDFESFNCSVLQDFVMIVSSYMSSLPIMFVFGVATSVSALHKSFPYHVSSKLLIKVFHSYSSPVYMNQVLEDIFLSHTSPFHLSGKAFELLTDVFLFYDFSVTGLIQSIKYCMMEHHYGDDIKVLCCRRDDISNAVKSLSAENLEDVRTLLSFRPYVESKDCKTRIALLEDDNFLRKILIREIIDFHNYMYSFYVCVKMLTAFVKEMPKSILGKTVREVYVKCTSSYIIETQSYRDCMQLISFQSQMKLVESIKNALKVINSAIPTDSKLHPLKSTPVKFNSNKPTVDEDTLGVNFIKTLRVHLMTFQRQMEVANTETTILCDPVDSSDAENTPRSRYKLKEKLLKATKGERTQSEFEMIRSRFVSYLEDVFRNGLRPPESKAFHELFFFNDISSVKKVIIGSPRGALHTALSNPIHYLHCTCCLLPSPESVSGTLPDICIAYKLHRECGKHINLYDWMQAFAAVLRPQADDDDDETVQDPDIQIRFTRAVAELQFLGFIKSSKRKTDHVMRLTW